MRLIDEFVNKVLTDEGSFVLVDQRENCKDCRYIQFMQSKVGNGRYVYAFYGWNPDFNTEFDNKAELIAIIADEIVYTVEDYIFNIWKSEDRRNLPKNHKCFNLKIKEKNDYIRNVVFENFYNSLEIKSFENENFLEDCYKEARNILLQKGSLIEEIKIPPMFGERAVAKVLCGLIDIEKEALQRFEANREDWVETKAKREKIKELVRASTGVESWELELANGVKSVDAMNVTVEFEFNNKIASGKINPDRILRNLAERRAFSDYDFVTYSQGKKILKTLGAEEAWRSENNLKCEHITRITYGKKELYVKTK